MKEIAKLREKLIETKRRLGLTNYEIAEDIGCSESTISEIISGKRKNVVPRTYFIIEKWLFCEK